MPVQHPTRVSGREAISHSVCGCACGPTCSALARKVEKCVRGLFALIRSFFKYLYHLAVGESKGKSKTSPAPSGLSPARVQPAPHSSSVTGRVAAASGRAAGLSFSPPDSSSDEDEGPVSGRSGDLGVRAFGDGEAFSSEAAGSDEVLEADGEGSEPGSSVLSRSGHISPAHTPPPAGPCAVWIGLLRAEAPLTAVQFYQFGYEYTRAFATGPFPERGEWQVQRSRIQQRLNTQWQEPSFQEAVRALSRQHNYTAPITEAADAFSVLGRLSSDQFQEETIVGYLERAHVHFERDVARNVRGEDGRVEQKPGMLIHVSGDVLEGLSFLQGVDRKPIVFQREGARVFIEKDKFSTLYGWIRYQQTACAKIQDIFDRDYQNLNGVSWGLHIEETGFAQYRIVVRNGEITPKVIYSLQKLLMHAEKGLPKAQQKWGATVYDDLCYDRQMQQTQLWMDHGITGISWSLVEPIYDNFTSAPDLHERFEKALHKLLPEEQFVLGRNSKTMADLFQQNDNFRIFLMQGILQSENQTQLFQRLQENLSALKGRLLTAQEIEKEGQLRALATSELRNPTEIARREKAFRDEFNISRGQAELLQGQDQEEGSVVIFATGLQIQTRSDAVMRFLEMIMRENLLGLTAFNGQPKNFIDESRASGRLHLANFSEKQLEEVIVVLEAYAHAKGTSTWTPRFRAEAPVGAFCDNHVEFINNYRRCEVGRLTTMFQTWPQCPPAWIRAQLRPIEEAATLEGIEKAKANALKVFLAEKTVCGPTTWRQDLLDVSPTDIAARFYQGLASSLQGLVRLRAQYACVIASLKGLSCYRECAKNASFQTAMGNLEARFARELQTDDRWYTAGNNLDLSFAYFAKTIYFLSEFQRRALEFDSADPSPAAERARKRYADAQKCLLDHFTKEQTWQGCMDGFYSRMQKLFYNIAGDPQNPALQYKKELKDEYWTLFLSSGVYQGEQVSPEMYFEQALSAQIGLGLSRTPNASSYDRQATQAAAFIKGHLYPYDLFTSYYELFLKDLYEAKKKHEQPSMLASRLGIEDEDLTTRWHEYFVDGDWDYFRLEQDLPKLTIDWLIAGEYLRYASQVRVHGIELDRLQDRDVRARWLDAERSGAYRLQENAVSPVEKETELKQAAQAAQARSKAAQDRGDAAQAKTDADAVKRNKEAADEVRRKRHEAWHSPWARCVAVAT